MSQLSQAKKRMFLRSSSIMEAEEEENDIPVFNRNNTNKTNFVVYPNQFDTASINKHKAQQWKKKDRSPQFAKTDRWGQVSADDRFDSRSEQPNQLNLFGEQKKRRGTHHARYNNEPQSPTIRDVSFTEQDESVYDESPIKQLKETVHKEKLNLVLSKKPQHKAFSPVKPRQCLYEETQKIIKQEKSKSENFVDVMFPPKFSIIYNKRYMYLDEGVKFERLFKIYDREKVSIVKFCEPTYLVMGKYTSCAVYSALCILAEEPALILNLLSNQQINHQGIYHINLCKDGVWRYFIVDDFMPVKVAIRRNLMCLNSSPYSNACEVWPCLVEKALAKMYGTYQDLYLTSSRGIKQIFTNLTGFPVSQFAINKDFRAFLVLIDTALKKKHIVVLESVKQQYLQAAMIKKLDPGFSYKIIEVKKTYILLRNLVEREIVTKLTFQEAMIFSRLLIFRWEPSYVYMSRTLRHKISYYSAVSVKVDKTMKCYWKVQQNSEVYYKNHIGSKIQYQESPYAIFLQRELSGDESQTEKQYASGSSQIEAGKEIQMKEGSYTIMVHLCQKRQLDFTLVFYGERQLQKMQRVRCSEKWGMQCECQILTN